jgi:DNA invertase Pin-like site-specific DNA recombinase
MITERTRAGVKAAQRRGVKFGRKPKMTPQQVTHARKLIESGDDRAKVAALFNVGRKTLFRALNAAAA